MKSTASNNSSTFSALHALLPSSTGDAASTIGWMGLAFTLKQYLPWIVTILGQVLALASTPFVYLLERESHITSRLSPLFVHIVKSQDR